MPVKKIKFEPELIDQIRYLAGTGITKRQIAEEIEVPEQLFYKISQRQKEVRDIFNVERAKNSLCDIPETEPISYRPGVGS